MHKTDETVEYGTLHRSMTTCFAVTKGTQHVFDGLFSALVAYGSLRTAVRNLFGISKSTYVALGSGLSLLGLLVIR